MFLKTPVKKFSLLIIAGSCLFFSCGNNDPEYDASGTFEATEIIVSAEATGRLLRFNVEEGDSLAKGADVGLIDSTQLHLARIQATESRNAILSGRPDLRKQIDATKKQINNAMIDKQRIENLVKANVASPQQLDDINSKLEVLRAQLLAQESSLQNSTSAMNQQGNASGAQLLQIEDQLGKCVITSPVAGTVLTTYIHEGELAVAGKPLFRIADLNEMILRAYITGDQLQQIKNGQQVKVFTMAGEENKHAYDGKIMWISNKSEFTPKTIQTKDERANLVYAIKIKVRNDGFIKIGMYGEVKF